MPALAEIQGQTRAVAQLERALAAGKVPHAYLFVGPPGAGRGATAVALARALACEAGGRCVGETLCATCARFEARSHPDLLGLVPSGAGNVIAVADVRELITRLALPPHEARARVVIVDQAERLRAEGANALLKTLEEPPSRTHFVLLAASTELLLPTIRSRCQTVRFAPLGADEIVEILAARGVGATEARAAAALADGSIGRAVELAESEGLADVAAAAEKIVGAARGRGLRVVIETAAQVAQEQKERLARVIELIAVWHRDAAAQDAGAESRLGGGEIAPAVPVGIRGVAHARAATAAMEAVQALDGNAQAALTLERLGIALREAYAS